MGDTIKMKRPSFPPPREDDPSGCVKRDDRGNAIWQWKDDDTLNQALVHPALSVADEEPPPSANVKLNVVGGVKGYDPYASGLLAGKDRSRRKDLRELSKWIAMKRRLDGSSGE